MIEKYITEVSLDFFNGDETDVKDTIEEIRLFAKTYENDKVTVLSVTENESSKEKTIKFFYSTKEIQIIQDVNMNMMKKNYSVSLKMKNSYYPVSAYKEPTFQWVFSIIHLHNHKIYLIIKPAQGCPLQF